MATKTKKSETTDLKKQIDKTAKLFDVAQPGKTPAPATSRPVIVGHSAGIKRDPMVVDEAPAPKKHATKPKPEKPADETPQEDEVPKLTVKSKVIQPLSAPEAAKPEPEAAEPIKEDPAATTDEPKPPVDTLINQIDSKQADKKQKKDLEDNAKEVESLIASQQYFVPIGLVSKRRSHHRIIALLILTVVIVVVGLNFAIDAEAVDIGVDALTNIL